MLWDVRPVYCACIASFTLRQGYLSSIGDRSHKQCKHLATTVWRNSRLIDTMRILSSYAQASQAENGPYLFHARTIDVTDTLLSSNLFLANWKKTHSSFFIACKMMTMFEGVRFRRSGQKSVGSKHSGQHVPRDTKYYILPYKDVLFIIYTSEALVKTDHKSIPLRQTPPSDLLRPIKVKVSFAALNNTQKSYSFLRYLLTPIFSTRKFFSARYFSHLSVLCIQFTTMHEMGKNMSVEGLDIQRVSLAQFQALSQSETCHG